MKEPLQIRYGFLASIPDALLEPTAVNLHGRLSDRGPTVARLYGELLDGRLPAADELAWPEEPLRGQLHDALEASGLARACHADATLTTEVLLYILGEVDTAERFYERALVAFSGMKPDPHPALRDLPAAGDAVADAEALARQLMCEGFGQRIRQWIDDEMSLYVSLREGLRVLCHQFGLPPGFERGVLRSLPRDDLMKVRELLAKIDAVRRFVCALGRGQEGDLHEETVLERIAKSVTRTVERVAPTRGREGAEVRGVERSGELARMLPGEAALLTHPTLRKLWHVRRAERALLSYRARGVWTERVRETQSFEDGEVANHRRAECGPVIVVLDTSGSMWGAPEAAAKAITLQVLAACARDRRACYVYNFSGPGDLLEHELTHDDGQGMVDVLRFLAASFHGGTQPDEALRLAAARLETGPWRQADLLVVSDGMFDGRRGREILAAARERCHARVVGVRLASRDHIEAMRAGIEAAVAQRSESDPVDWNGGASGLDAERARAPTELDGWFAQLEELGDGFAGLDCDEVHDLVDWLEDVSDELRHD